MSSESATTTVDGLRAQLAEIERTLGSKTYKPGQWDALLRELRAEPDQVRRSLAGDVSRASRKLHQRTARATMPFDLALLLEGVGTALGGVLLALAVAGESTVLAILGAFAWGTTFQPLVKISVGRALGIAYDYAYLFHVEPRFKMSFGTYLAAPRWARITFHLSGIVGSPLGLAAAAVLVGGTLPATAGFMWIVLWLVNLGNLVPFIGGLAGVPRLGAWRFTIASGGVAGVELREALGLAG
ncbi:MAG: hypothetical protein ACREQF_01680 [Candidatus Binataceae bacterium]